MSSFFKMLFKVFKRLLLPALPAVAIVLSGGCSSNCADNTIDVGEQSEIIILGEGRINSDIELYPGDSVKVTYVIENGENIVVTVTMNDSSAGEGRFYSSPPSFSSLTLVASLTE